MKDNNSKDKKDLLKSLLVSEEDTLEILSELVELSKEYIKIESKTGRVLFEDISKHTNIEKIELLLIGQYFSKELGLVSKHSLSSSEIGKILDIPTTTLSNPIGKLIKSNVLKKEGDEYRIAYYKIKEVLENMNKGSVSIPIKKITKKKKTSSKKKCLQEKEEEPANIGDDTGIENLVKYLGVEKTDILRILEFDEDINFLVVVPGENNEERQLKSTLVLLLCYFYYYGTDRILANSLIKKLEDLGIKSLVNLSTYLQKYPQYIIHKKGKKGSIINYYKITLPGREYAKEILLSLINQNGKS